MLLNLTLCIIVLLILVKCDLLKFRACDNCPVIKLLPPIDIVKDRNETIVTFPDEIPLVLEFDCFATYPINWIFHINEVTNFFYMN